jgi:hypothetical protein
MIGIIGRNIRDHRGSRLLRTDRKSIYPEHETQQEIGKLGKYMCENRKLNLVANCDHSYDSFCLLYPHTCALKHSVIAYCTIAKPEPSLANLHSLGASARTSGAIVPTTTLATTLFKACNRGERTSVRIRAPRLVGSARVSRLGAHRETGAVRPRSPGWGVKTAVTLVRALLRETASVAVAESGSAAGQSSLASLVGLDVGLLGPSHESGATQEANGHAKDDADDGHGVCVLGLAVVDVPGEQVGEAGAGVDRGGVGAVEAGARATVAHDAGRHGHVEAEDCRGHVGWTGGTGVVVAVVDGGEMHFRSVGGCGNAGVGECSESIGFQTSQMIF